MAMRAADGAQEVRAAPVVLPLLLQRLLNEQQPDGCEEAAEGGHAVVSSDRYRVRYPCTRPRSSHEVRRDGDGRWKAGGSIGEEELDRVCDEPRLPASRLSLPTVPVWLDLRTYSSTASQEVRLGLARTRGQTFVLASTARTAPPRTSANNYRVWRTPKSESGNALSLSSLG